jgi:hypothetical protein
VVCGSGLRSIGGHAFDPCVALSSVSFGSSLISIGGSAFSGTSISAAEFPDTVQEINDSAFAQCQQLQSVSFGNSLKRIAQLAFSNCSKLSAIKSSASSSMLSFPDSLQSIGRSAFYSAALQYTQATLGRSLTFVGMDAFTAFPNLAMIYVEGNLTFEHQTLPALILICSNETVTCDWFPITSNSNCSIPPPTPPPSHTAPHDKLTTGEIAGIAAASGVGFLVIVGLIVFLILRHVKKNGAGGDQLQTAIRTAPLYTN